MAIAVCINSRIHAGAKVGKIANLSLVLYHIYVHFAIRSDVM